ncbi:MAG: hypothetical protein ABI212_06470 [Burkholderiaceae bacterium]
MTRRPELDAVRGQLAMWHALEWGALKICSCQAALLLFCTW